MRRYVVAKSTLDSFTGDDIISHRDAIVILASDHDAAMQAITDDNAALVAVLDAVHKCQPEIDAEGHAFLKVPARSIFDLGAIIAETLKQPHPGDAIAKTIAAAQERVKVLEKEQSDHSYDVMVPLEKYEQMEHAAQLARALLEVQRVRMLWAGDSVSNAAIGQEMHNALTDLLHSTGYFERQAAEKRQALRDAKGEGGG